MKDLISREKLLSVIGALIVVIGGYSASRLDKAVETISELNVKIAVVIEKISNHEGRLMSLEHKEK